MRGRRRVFVCRGSVLRDGSKSRGKGGKERVTGKERSVDARAWEGLQRC